MIQNLPATCADCGKSDPPPTMTAGVSYRLSRTSTAIMWSLKAWCDDCAAALTLDQVAGAREWGAYSHRLADNYRVLNPDQAKLGLEMERFERT